ncbi:MAG: hypothetical protein Q9191_008525, partial [Dirinaria sp. TL-2023a]
EFMKYAYGEWLQVGGASWKADLQGAALIQTAQTFATLTFTKISICLFLLRITITKAFIRPLYVAIAILAISNIVLSLLWILQCTPHLDKAWNTKMPGKCFSKGQLERIIISQASKKPRRDSRTGSVRQLTGPFFSYIDYLGLLPLRFPHSHPSQSPNRLSEQSRPLLTHGTRSHVSRRY